MNIQLHKDYLIKELNLPDAAIKDTIIETTRWSIIHEIIFAHDGKFWKTTYSVGATEVQDESPWEYDDLVDCREVQLVEKTVKVWEEVK
jgi:hypothetical protein